MFILGDHCENYGIELRFTKLEKNSVKRFETFPVAKCLNGGVFSTSENSHR